MVRIGDEIEISNANLRSYLIRTTDMFFDYELNNIIQDEIWIKLLDKTWFDVTLKLNGYKNG